MIIWEKDLPVKWPPCIYLYSGMLRELTLGIVGSGTILIIINTEMSLYTGNSFFHNQKPQGMQSDVQKEQMVEQLIQPFEELRDFVDTLRDINTWKDLQWLRADMSKEAMSQPVTWDTRLSAQKIEDFFDNQKLHDEAEMIHRLLKTVGHAEDDDFVFTPKQLSDHLNYLE